MEKKLSKMNRIELIDAMEELVRERDALKTSLSEAKKAARETQDRLTKKENELDESRRLMMQMQEQLIACRCSLAAAEGKLEAAEKYRGRNLGVPAPLNHDKSELTAAILRIKRPKQEE